MLLLHMDMKLFIKSLFKPDLKIILFSTLLVGLISLAVLIALNKIENQTKASSQHALSTVLATTQESLYLWLEQRQLEVQELAATEPMRQLTVSLLSASHSPEELINSLALKKMRMLFQSKIDRHGYKEIFVINPAMISIASMRDSNIGSINFISKHSKKHLEDAFNGMTKFISTTSSDISLFNSNGLLKEKLPTQFIFSPIVDIDKKIISVLAVRLDPKRNFSRIIQFGRIGHSGESYAFDAQGILISESRFDDQLTVTGLVHPGSRGITNISIKDPGGNLTKGFNIPITLDKLPFTLMAENALAGNAGYNTDGYRDYRGVRVFGVWLWDEKLGIGLTTEIDESEAMQAYYSTRLIFILVLCFSFVLVYLLVSVYKQSE